MNQADDRTATDEPEPVQLSLLDQPPAEPETVRFGTEGAPGFDDHGFPLEYDRIAA